VTQVLDGVSLTVAAGSVAALLGPNGAGKTTLLRAITGLIGVNRGKVVKGRIDLDGQDLVGRSAAAVVRSGVAQVMEGRRMFAELTVDANLRASGYSAKRAVANQRRDEVYALFPRLVDLSSRQAGLLSGGEQQMVAIGRALMCGPRLLILDEPSLGLAPQIVSQLRDLIRQINEAGTTVLLVEQDASMALSVADHGYVIESGRVVMDRPAAELAKDDDIREFYLGVGSASSSFRDVKHYRRRKRWLS